MELRSSRCVILSAGGGFIRKEIADQRREKKKSRPAGLSAAHELSLNDETLDFFSNRLGKDDKPPTRHQQLPIHLTFKSFSTDSRLADVALLFSNFGDPVESRLPVLFPFDRWDPSCVGRTWPAPPISEGIMATDAPGAKMRGAPVERGSGLLLWKTSNGILISPK